MGWATLILCCNIGANVLLLVQTTVAGVEERDTRDVPVEPSADLNSVELDAAVQKEKRVVKLTAKAFSEKLERLHHERKSKLNKTSNVITVFARSYGQK